MGSNTSVNSNASSDPNNPTYSNSSALTRPVTTSQPSTDINTRTPPQNNSTHPQTSSSSQSRPTDTHTNTHTPPSEINPPHTALYNNPTMSHTLRNTLSNSNSIYTTNTFNITDNINIQTASLNTAQSESHSETHLLSPSTHATGDMTQRNTLVLSPSSPSSQPRAQNQLTQLSAAARSTSTALRNFVRNGSFMTMNIPMIGSNANRKRDSGDNQFTRSLSSGTGVAVMSLEKGEAVNNLTKDKEKENIVESTVYNFCCLIKSKTREHNKRKEAKKSIWFEGKANGRLKIGSEVSCGLVLKDDRCDATHAIIKCETTEIHPNIVRNDLVLYPRARMYRLIDPTRNQKLDVGTVVKLGSISLEIINMNVNDEEDFIQSLTFLDPYHIKIYEVLVRENHVAKKVLKVKVKNSIKKKPLQTVFGEHEASGQNEEGLVPANQLGEASQGVAEDSKQDSRSLDSGNENDDSEGAQVLLGNTSSDQVENNCANVNGEPGFDSSMGVGLNRKSVDVEVMSDVPRDVHGFTEDTDADPEEPKDLLVDDVMCYICWGGIDLSQHKIDYLEDSTVTDRFENGINAFGSPNSSASEAAIGEEVVEVVNGPGLTTEQNEDHDEVVQTDFNPMIKNPCGNCSGCSQFIHYACLMRWIKTSKSGHCSICNGVLPSDFCCKPPNLELKIVRHRRGQHWVGTRRYRLSFAESTVKTLGSSFRADIRLPDVSVSDLHANLKYDKRRKAFFISDNNSKGGTYLQMSGPVVLSQSEELAQNNHDPIITGNATANIERLASAMDMLYMQNDGYNYFPSDPNALNGVDQNFRLNVTNEFKIGRSTLNIKVVPANNERKLKMLRRVPRVNWRPLLNNGTSIPTNFASASIDQSNVEVAITNGSQQGGVAENNVNENVNSDNGR